jgi:hypothetical protein
MNASIKAKILVIAQTLAAVGFGIYLVLATIMTRLPNGHEIVRQLLGTEKPPIMFIVVIFVLCCTGTFFITMDNITSLTFKVKGE